MKEDEGYFDSDEHDLNDSDLGEDDSVSTNAEEAYYAETGDKSLADDGDDHYDIDPATCELTIDSFSELIPCDEIGCTTSSTCISDKLYSEVGTHDLAETTMRRGAPRRGRHFLRDIDPADSSLCSLYRSTQHTCIDIETELR